MKPPGTGEFGEIAVPVLAGPEAAVYDDLCTWREQLVRSIARTNIGMRSSRIGQAVDQVIFSLLALALAEDRYLVHPGTLRTIAETGGGESRWPEILSAFGDPWSGTDETAGTGRNPEEVPAIDDALVREIAGRLAGSDRPYDLSEIPHETIAAILDRYLTRTVRRSAAHQAVVIDRPVIGAWQVEISPGLADYAAGRTLASACAGRSQADPLPFRVIDPACGAGRMLLFAYRYLRFLPGQKEPADLLQHTLHGIDPDPHAVAAARMLLALAACGDRTGPSTSEEFFTTFREYLAILSPTIRCGNALIGPAIEDDESWAFCVARERHEIRPFAWQEDYPEVLLPGGFDAVLCCPPEYPVPAREWLRQYFQRHYTVYDPGAGLSAYIMEKSLTVLRPGGVAGIVGSDRWLRARSGAPFRGLLLGRQLQEIVTAGENSCFLLVMNTRTARPFIVRNAGPAPAGAKMIGEIPGFPVDPGDLVTGGWVLRDTRRERLVEKISSNTTPLAEYVLGEIQYGAGTGPAPAERGNKDRITFSASEFPPLFVLTRSRAVPGPGTGIIPSGSRYLLGLLNSRLAKFMLRTFAEQTGDPGVIVARFPVATPDFDDPAEAARHWRLEALVTERLVLARHHTLARSARERQAIEADIASTEKQIESLVYGIYGLSIDEIAFVESLLPSENASSFKKCP
jgi:SAM-dependent methyltransferase